MEFLQKAGSKQAEAVNNVDKLLATVDEQRSGVKSRLASEKDPAGRRQLEKQLAELNALGESKNLEKTELGLGANKLEIGQLEIQKAQFAQGAIPLEERLQGVDRGTFGGAVQASRLEQQEALIKANAAQAQIDLLNKTNSGLPANSPQAQINSQFAEKLGVERSQQLAVAAQAGRAGVGAQFAKAEGGLNLQRALIESSHAIEDEIAKRREASDALAQSKNALADFEKSLESARADREGNLVSLGQRIEKQGGHVAGLDTSPENLKQIQLAGDVAKFNEQAAQLGTFANAQGGSRAGLISAGSPFEQEIAGRRDSLELGVNRAERNEEEIPVDTALSALANKKTIADLTARLGGNAPATLAALGLGAPGFGLPTPKGFSGQTTQSAEEAINNSQEGGSGSNTNETLEAKIDELINIWKSTPTMKLDPATIQAGATATGQAVG
ncbi:MAG: hypothetical protein ACREJM_04875, partial [Candidatus Saccharimonadales bacterium]